MKISVKKLVLTSFLLTSFAAQASPLIIHAAEVGIGKFHRYDNGVHAYTKGSPWANYFLPKGADGHQQVVQKNTDGSVTIFFNDLEDLLRATVAVAKSSGQKVAIFNLEAHGMPGGMWFPKDAATRDSGECARWSENAYGADAISYNQYYSETPQDAIEYYRQYAAVPNHAHQDCVTDLTDFSEIAARVPEFISAFEPLAEVHFVSCIVGLGAAGDVFTHGMTQLLFSNQPGRVITSTFFGLGDWSTPEGMGYWDYFNDAQLAHDNAIYVKNKRDRDIALKGTIRVGQSDKGSVTTSLFDGIMFLNVDQPFNPTAAHLIEKRTRAMGALPPRAVEIVGRASHWVRLPRTGALMDLNR